MNMSQAANTVKIQKYTNTFEAIKNAGLNYPWLSNSSSCFELQSVIVNFVKFCRRKKIEFFNDNLKHLKRFKGTCLRLGKKVTYFFDKETIFADTMNDLSSGALPMCTLIVIEDSARAKWTITLIIAAWLPQVLGPFWFFGWCFLFFFFCFWRVYWDGGKCANTLIIEPGLENTSTSSFGAFLLSVFFLLLLFVSFLFSVVCFFLLLFVIFFHFLLSVFLFVFCFWLLIGDGGGAKWTITYLPRYFFFLFSGQWALLRVS